jgi:Tol biopolymer transport system component
MAQICLPTIINEGKNWYSRWSPDGRWLTCTTSAVGGESGDIDIYVVAVDGGQQPVKLIGGAKREQGGR